MINKTLFLGAGFSAPLGIPTMSTFIETSKDLYETDPQKYESFTNVYKIIRELYYINFNMEMDLRNIEIVFSLIEMTNYLSSTTLSLPEFEDFIKKVIIGSSPKISLDREYLHKNLRGEHVYLLENRTQDLYLKLFIKLMGIELEILNRNDQIYTSVSENLTNTVNVNIVTLNYDTLVEEFNKTIESYSLEKQKIRKIPLAKLHGSINGSIVPPTWNKSGNEFIKDAWQNAYNMLSTSHEIIFLGYSLPESDAYIKYLLASSMKNNENIKKIKVYNIDFNKNTKARYDSLFSNALGSKYEYYQESVISYINHEISSMVMLNYKSNLSRTYCSRE